MCAWQLKNSLAEGQISSREVMESVLDEIDRREAEIKAYITIRDRSELLSEADEIDARRVRGETLGILDGLPVAVKDNMCTKDLLTTCGSRMLGNFVPPYDATVVERLRRADGIILGKTNMDEFAMGSSTEHSAMHLTRNPHDLSYVPGGTSGGSAAAVAAHETILALGSDTGGSIRQPASYCGVVGMKPTYGRVSRYGLVAHGSSLDQIGVLTKDVRDAALLMGVIAGHDPRDSTSIEAQVPDYMALLNGPDTLRIGVPDEYFGAGLDKEVHDKVRAAIGCFEQDGHEIVPLNLPHTDYGVAAYYIIVCSEASSNLSRYSGVHYGFRADDLSSIEDLFVKSRSLGFGPEVKRRIMLGTFALSAGYYDAYYLKASKARTLLVSDFEKAFETCDIIAHPVTPGPAFKIGQNVDDPLAMYLVDVYSVIANLVGIPAVSVPCGWTKGGLPIGIQLAGRHLAESTVLAAAGRLEKLIKEAQVSPDSVP
jgi:aspartyl-tRNA(Asn)/glutamyl-tRNA(Gln) amidotransferase subunit A